MTAADKNWIEKTLLDHDRTKFERIGTKRLIFKVNHHAPLASLFIDPPPAVNVGWMPGTGGSLTHALFERLSPIVAHRCCTLFFVTLPQDEYTVLQWVAPLNMATWNSSRLYAFENTGSEGGAQSLCVTLGREALLVFTLKDGFEIAFHGPDDLWQEVTDALYGPGGMQHSAT